MRSDHKQGFTLIELVVVVCIIAILVSLGIGIYRRATLTQYDTEAVATLNHFYVQISRKVNDWGISSESDSVGLTPGCEVVDMRNGTPIILPSGRNYQLDIDSSLPNHWVYQICVGFLDADPTSEAYILSAHREIASGEYRIILMSSSLQDPVLGASETLPTSVKLRNVTWFADPIPTTL